MTSAESASSLASASNAPCEADGLVAAVKRGDQVLAAVLGPGDRASQLARQPDQDDVFGHERHLLAEAAADIRRDDAQIALRHADADRQSPCAAGAASASAQVSVTRPDAGSKAAWPARASSGVAFWRRERSSMAMRRCAAPCAAANPGVSILPSTTTLRAACACTSGAPSRERRARIDDRRGLRLMSTDDGVGDVFGLALRSRRSTRRSARRRSAPRPMARTGWAIGT